MDTLLKALNCFGKFLQIIQTGLFLMKHLGM